MSVFEDYITALGRLYAAREHDLTQKEEYDFTCELQDLWNQLTDEERQKIEERTEAHKLHQMNCFVCLRRLRPIEDPSDQHPDDAVVFSSQGNYGSTVYDNFNGDEFLELYICDQCLRSRDQHVFTARRVRPQRRPYHLYRRGVHHDPLSYAPFQEAIRVALKIEDNCHACPLCAMRGEHHRTCELGTLIESLKRIYGGDV